MLGAGEFWDLKKDYPVGFRQYLKRGSREAVENGFRSKVDLVMELVDGCERLGVAAATVLREYPIANSTLEENQIKILKNINVGVATERGLMVPVIHDADEKPLADLTTTIAELVEKVRLDKLSMGEVTGGTFTITNLGMFGVNGADFRDAFYVVVLNFQGFYV